MQQDLALYLHMPFCDRKCAYCDFNSYAGMESVIPAYSQAICRELELWGPAVQDDIVRTVFFGGGTPSLTPLDQMAEILGRVNTCYRLGVATELSLEANPGTVDVEYLRGLRHLGINRLSLGVQSFDDEELRVLDRIHSADEAIAAFRAARDAGFDNVNLDLIYGLENQTTDGWRRNLEQAIELRPEHLSVYALTVEDGTALATAVARGSSPSPDPDLQADMYELAQELLTLAGYEQYEISNWALPGRACLHNLSYWRNARWLGLGAGAHSSLGGYRFSNARSPQGYINRVGQASTMVSCATPIFQGMPQVVWSEQIDAPMAISDTAILGLRLIEGISLTQFHARHGVDLLDVHGDAVTRALEYGLLQLDGDQLRLSRRGLLLANEVFSSLLPESATLVPEPNAPSRADVARAAG